MYICWLLATLILSNVHSSTLYSLLTLPQYGKKIDTTKQLIAAAASDSHRIVHKDDGTIYSAVFKAQHLNKLFYMIKKHVQRNQVKLYHKVQEIIPIVESSPKNILLSYEIKLLSLRALYASKLLHIGKESISQLYLCWAFRKSSALVSIFNKR